MIVPRANTHEKLVLYYCPFLSSRGATIFPPVFLCLLRFLCDPPAQIGRGPTADPNHVFVFSARSLRLCGECFRFNQLLSRTTSTSWSRLAAVWGRMVSQCRSFFPRPDTCKTRGTEIDERDLPKTRLCVARLERLAMPAEIAGQKTSGIGMVSCGRLAIGLPKHAVHLPTPGIRRFRSPPQTTKARGIMGQCPRPPRRTPAGT